ncbi:hypothetical protein HII36_26405 [Nonomuraea sp. NN258]|nr:hypothetical protein [Nonomuraea antri]
MADEQEIEVAEFTDDLGLNHEIAEDDPQHRDTLDERLRREAPDKLHEPRPQHRLTEPDEGLEPDHEGEAIATDWGSDTGSLQAESDLSAEERAVRVDPDDELT